MNKFKQKILSKLGRSLGLGVREAVAQLRDEMVAAGLTPPNEFLADGKIHRFSSNGRMGDTSGWYVLYLDPIPAGAYGCWRSQLSASWSSRSDTSLTDQERLQLRQKMADANRVRDEEQRRRHEASALRAQQRLEKSQPVLAHPYLDRKKVQPHGLREENGVLLIPMYNESGTLTSLQTIDAEGEKRFMAGGQVAGCFHSLGEVTTEILITEGFATGATVHELTKSLVVIAFSAGNLLAVAKIFRKRFPKAQIVVAADNDSQTTGNPGMTKAKEAAAAVGGRLAVPVFQLHPGRGFTDFNDLYVSEGAQAVLDCIYASPAIAPDGDVWPNPRPVKTAPPQVEELHPDLIPEVLRGWITDISMRMGCKPDFPAVAALVALSSLIGARAVIAPKAMDTWTVAPLLWGQIIAPPGSLKSPALSEALRAVNHLDSKDRDLWRIAHARWESQAKLHKLAAEANEKEAKAYATRDPGKAQSLLAGVAKFSEEEPKLRRRILNDSTVEKLAEVLAKHPYGVLVYRDELHGLLSHMDRAGQEGARSFYLQGYDGNQPYTVDRIGRGTLHIPRVCIAMLGSIQPGLLQEYVQNCVEGGSGNDGLLQRFSLSVWPDQDSSYQYIDQSPDEDAEQLAFTVFDRLDRLRPDSRGEPIVWRYSSGAQVIFKEWLTDLEIELRGPDLSPTLASHFSKYRKLVPALSLVFALIDTPESDHVVAERELRRAIAWAKYLRTHAERMYDVRSSPTIEKADLLLSKLRERWAVDTPNAGAVTFTPREIAAKGWVGLERPMTFARPPKLL